MSSSENNGERQNSPDSPWLSFFKYPLANALFWTFFDQLTKILIDKTYEVGEHTPVVDGFFHIVHFRNTGAAWGIFSGRSYLLAVVSFAAFCAVVWKFREMADGSPLRGFAVSLISGGIIGNMIDRVFRAEVVDFLFFFYKNWSWPAFNVADSAICVGVALYVFSSMMHCNCEKGDPRNAVEEAS